MMEPRCKIIFLEIKLAITMKLPTVQDMHENCSDCLGIATSRLDIIDVELSVNEYVLKYLECDAFI